MEQLRVVREPVMKLPAKKWKRLSKDTIQITETVKTTKTVSISELKNRKEQLLSQSCPITDEEVLEMARFEAERFRAEQVEEQARMQKEVEEIDKEILKYEGLKWQNHLLHTRL